MSEKQCKWEKLVKNIAGINR